MNFSLFLGLLPFTLSAPSPYNMSFHSHLHTVPYFQEIMETTFKITGHGIFIWKIPEVDRIYDEFNNSSERNFNAFLANNLSTYWPVTVDAVHFTLPDWEPINLELGTNETYILLKVNTNNECFGFYWVGKQSDLAKRQLTARLVIRMIYELGLQMKEAKLVHLSREEENEESEVFLDHFKTEHSRFNLRLFKITGSKAQFIMEVPLKYNELHHSGMFILDKMSNLYVWSADSRHAKPFYIKMSTAFRQYIRYYEKRSCKLQVRLSNKAKVKKYIHIKRRFFKAIKDVPPQRDFPAVFTVTETDEELLNGIIRLWQLFQYTLINNWVVSIEINKRLLTLEDLDQYKAYVMTDSISGRIFVYFGANASFVQMEQAIAAAEIIYLDSEGHEWTNVTIIRQVDLPNWPLHFIIHFPEVHGILELLSQ